MQILSTIKSIFRLKFTHKMNLHFQTLTYIFRHTHPYRIIDTIFMQNFSAIFSTRHTRFLKTIKCIQYTLLLIENYSQVIFYKIFHNLPQFDTIRLVYNIHCWITAQFETSCRFMKLNVEDCKSYFFPSLSLYPYIWKLFKE